MSAATRVASAGERVAVHAAPAQLRAWSPCLVVRRIDGATPVDARVHANTFACLNVLARGRVEVGGLPQPARFLAGPLSRPRETRSHGPLASASLVLQPWVLEPWWALRVDGLADRLVDSAELRGSSLDALGDALVAVCEDARHVPAVWTALEALAHAHRAPSPALALPVLEAGGVEAAAAAVGCSDRQYRRRFRRALGLAPAAWLRVRRWEQAVQAVLDAGPPQPLAAVAADFGYADQAHLARDTRAFVEGTPAGLRGAAAADAVAWSLAPARVRILQDGDEGAP